MDDALLVRGSRASAICALSIEDLDKGTRSLPHAIGERLAGEVLGRHRLRQHLDANRAF